MKYKLLKSLPDWPEGTVFESNEASWTWACNGDSGAVSPSWMKELLGSAEEYASEWFEPIEDTPLRWRAHRGQPYFLVASLAKVEQDIEDSMTIDDRRYDCGNYFRTKDQAEAVAEAIKALFEYVHTPEEGRVEMGRKLARLTLAARILVQEAGDEPA